MEWPPPPLPHIVCAILPKEWVREVGHKLTARNTGWLQLSTALVALWMGQCTGMQMLPWCYILPVRSTLLMLTLPSLVGAIMLQLGDSANCRIKCGFVVFQSMHLLCEAKLFNLCWTFYASLWQSSWISSLLCQSNQLVLIMQQIYHRMSCLFQVCSLLHCYEPPSMHLQTTGPTTHNKGADSMFPVTKQACNSHQTLAAGLNLF